MNESQDPETLAQAFLDLWRDNLLRWSLEMQQPGATSAVKSAQQKDQPKP